MNLIEAFVQNPVKVTVGVLMVALFGFISLFRMPMQLTPEVQIPTITVETRWPGASPQEVEREIIEEQEEQLKSVEGLVKLTGESMDSLGRVTMEFLVGSNMDEVLLKVNSRLQQVPDYPEDADEPVIATSNSSDRPIAWFILGLKQPHKEEIVAFQQKHPEIASKLEFIRRAENPGLVLYKLRELAEEHPEVSELLPPEQDVTKLKRFCEDVIEARFERVAGVSNSNVIGGLEDEMQVVVNPQQLAARQLTIYDVRTALRSQNKDTSGGDFWEGKRRYVVRTLGQFSSPEDVENQLLAVRNDAPVYVRDVAEVRLGYKKPDGVVRRFGSSTIAVNALRETGANVLDVMDGLREATTELNEHYLFPRGLELTQVYDETEYIYSAIGLVNSNIVIGGILTIAVLLLFLRSGRSTLVIALAIPSSIIGTFLMLDLMGRSLNVISLAGLAFAVGMLVDNAVVVLENIFRRYQTGERPFVAAARGTQEVWGAVASSTLTTLAVFLPVLFVQEEAGQLFRDIALAISAAVGLSMIISITLIPTFSARLFRNQPHEEDDEEETFLWSRDGNGHEHREVRAQRRPDTKQTAFAKAWSKFTHFVLLPVDAFARHFVNAVVAANAFLQRSVLRRLAVVGVLVGSAVMLSWLLMPKVEYLPSGNRNLVIGILLPPPGYNIDKLMALGTHVENATKPYWDVEPGTPEAEALDYPVISDYFFVARGRQVFLGVRAADSMRAGQLVGLVNNVSKQLPGTIAFASQTSLFESGLSGGRTVDVEITGPDLEKLVELGRTVFGQAMAEFPEGQSKPTPSLDLSSPEIHVKPRKLVSADMQMRADELGYTVDALVDGAYAGDYFVDGDKIDLTIIGQSEFARQTQDVEALTVATATGDLVPLGSLAEVELSSGPEQINHRERQRAITIEVKPPPQVALEDAMERIESKIVQPLRESGRLDGGYMVTLAGTADKLNNTWEAMRFNLLLALLITYLLMAALFESWLYPFVIILSVPLGAVGGILGLNALNYGMRLFNPDFVQPLDVLTMLGFVILIGTVVNNAILIVHQSLNHMREDGMDETAAVLESVRTRIRPIFMTTTTTVLGLLPLVLIPGAGSELYRGLGSVVLGGLIVSTIFTLFLVPTMFSLMMDAKHFIIRQLHRREFDSQLRRPKHTSPPLPASTPR